MTLKDLEKKILLIDKEYHNRRCCLKIIEDIKADIIKTINKCTLMSTFFEDSYDFMPKFCMDAPNDYKCEGCQRQIEWSGVTEKELMKE